MGSYANRLVGEGLSFTPQQTLPAREIVGFELLDKDTFESDVLEAFQSLVWVSHRQKL